MARRRNIYGTRPLSKQAAPRRPMPRPVKGSLPTAGPSTPRSQPPGPPLDPLYTEQLGLNQRGLDTAMAGIGYGRTQIGQEYGYDPSGNLNPSNPFSRAALLQRSYQQGQAGTTTTMAAGGQLYSGAHQRNLDEGTHRYAASEDALKRAAAQAYQGLTEREAQALSEYEQGNLDARDASLGRANPEDFVPQGPRTVAPGQGGKKKPRQGRAVPWGQNRPSGTWGRKYAGRRR